MIKEYDKKDLRQLANTIRFLAADAIDKANSGHPGMPMGAADIASVLFSSFLNFNPNETNWAGRDRFVLSAGHGSMLLYSLLHLFSYDLTLQDLQNFRQWDSPTAGHPEFGMIPGIETTTGPLGQGFANAVGMALAAKSMGDKYSEELFNYRVFGICGDGDLMEGVACEAASLAGHLALDNLIFVYDDNDISIGGSTNICFTESVQKRFEAYNWHVQAIDGHDYQAIFKALNEATQEKERPSLICAKTTIGYGSPNKSGSSGVHGSPLGEEETQLAKKALKWPEDNKFYIPDEVKTFCKTIVSKRVASYNAWQEKFRAWQKDNAALAQEYQKQNDKVIPELLKEDLLATFSDVEKEATRVSSGKAIQVIAKHLPNLIGGSADLEPSNKTLINDSSDIAPKEFSGRNIRFGVREHAMGSIINGLAYSNNFFPYCGTFLVFADYLRPAIRIAALSHLQSLFVFTHDSFWVGEDGPTHQPVEHIASLRIIPNLYVFRPADGIEVAMCYHSALNIESAPSALLFSRQGLPALKREPDFSPDLIAKGAYVVYGKEHKDLVLIATGSEVALAVDAAKELETKGNKCRVVSIPCLELFKEQDQAYQEEVLPKAARKVSLEAGVSYGWHEVVGAQGLVIAMNRFGASAPGNILAEKFGFNTQDVVEKITGWL